MAAPPPSQTGGASDASFQQSLADMDAFFQKAQEQAMETTKHKVLGDAKVDTAHQRPAAG